LSDQANLVPTASQTVGPFFSIGLCPHNPSDLVSEQLPANARVITIRGRVLDGDGQAVPDAVLEIWRADENGGYAKPGDTISLNRSGVPSGFARIPTNEHGEFEIRTIRPGEIRVNQVTHAPHLSVVIFMRGLLRHLLTRIYFPDEVPNERDPVLSVVPAERRKTLIAAQSSDNQGELVWNVYLQGNQETVFFEA
jgi:protocatechuate 3,4-dioxygenase, alpha subunit